MAAEGWDVSVATPSYGTLHRLPDTRILTTIDVDFRGDSYSVGVWEVPSDSFGVRNIVFEHRFFSEHGSGLIYVGDHDQRPYANDADKFAFYAAAAAQWIFASERLPDVVHVHDWHAAFYLLLTNFAERFRHLKDIRTVFTIHNLSYQGIRPISGDESSLQAWFHGIHFDYGQIADPRYHDCVNPMAAAIRLADRVSTVSPTYAEEICRPTDPAKGFIGGEGLEEDLISARAEGRLAGVLNGCYYDVPLGRRPGWQRLLGMMQTQLEAWRVEKPSDEAHVLALERLVRLPKRRPTHVITSVGRLVAQKATLLLHEFEDGKSALQRIAANVENKGVILLLGSGDPQLEERLLQQARDIPNLIFLRGYSEDLAAPLYHGGDLFLMPSSFEPCGISQMLAMRSGQPCVVHGVGGLKDTIEDDETGFVFDGESVREQAGNFVRRTAYAIGLRASDPIRWQEICRAAATRRFDWQASARQTIQTLYGDDHER